MGNTDGAGFLYIASVSVVPELLAESKSAKQAIKEVRPARFTYSTSGDEALEMKLTDSTSRWLSVSFAW